MTSEKRKEKRIAEIKKPSNNKQTKLGRLVGPVITNWKHTVQKSRTPAKGNNNNNLHLFSASYDLKATLL